MPDTNTLHPLVNYQPTELIIGLGLLVVIGAWFGFIIWSTRHKVPKTIALLPPKPVDRSGLDAIKKKYLALIDDVNKETQAGRVTARQGHQKLSLLLRSFVLEASGFHAEVLTLADLKRTKLATLSAAIESYYPNEFAVMERGIVAESAAKAREVVQAWA